MAADLHLLDRASATESKPVPPGPPLPEPGPPGPGLPWPDPLPDPEPAPDDGLAALAWLPGARREGGTESNRRRERTYVSVVSASSVDRPCAA